MSPEGKDEKEKKKIRTTFSVDQISELENNFVQKKYLTSAERAELATELGVTLQQVGGHLYNGTLFILSVPQLLRL